MTAVACSRFYSFDLYATENWVSEYKVKWLLSPGAGISPWYPIEFIPLLSFSFLFFIRSQGETVHFSYGPFCFDLSQQKERWGSSTGPQEPPLTEQPAPAGWGSDQEERAGNAFSSGEIYCWEQWWGMDSKAPARRNCFQQLADVGCDPGSRTEPPCFVASLEEYIHPVQLPSPGCQNNTRSPHWRSFIIFIAQCILLLRGGRGCGGLTVNTSESIPFSAIGVFERVKALHSESGFCQPGKKQFEAGIKIPLLQRGYVGNYSGRKQLGRKKMLIENIVESREMGRRICHSFRWKMQFIFIRVLWFFISSLCSPPPKKKKKEVQTKLIFGPKTWFCFTTGGGKSWYIEVVWRFMEVVPAASYWQH